MVLRYFPWGKRSQTPQGRGWMFGIEMKLFLIAFVPSLIYALVVVRLSSKTPTRRSTLKTRNVWAVRLGWNCRELIFVSRPLMGKKDRSQTQYPTFDPFCFVFSCHTFHYAMPASSIHRSPLVFIGAKSANIKVPIRQFVHMILNIQDSFFIQISESLKSKNVHKTRGCISFVKSIAKCSLRRLCCKM